MKKPQAIIWDFDGVLIDSEILQIKAEIETARKFGIPLTPEIAEEYIGYKMQDYFSMLVRRFNINVPVFEIIQEHSKTLYHYYKEVFPLSPHAEEVLKELGSKYRQGIATNRERELALASLRRFGLVNIFQAMVFGEDIDHGKPDPEPYIKVAELLGVEPELCVAVEDSPLGFQSAKRAGMLVVARKAEHNLNFDFSQADYVIVDLREILSILKGI
ncbi:MAG: HAD family hydrolase [Spirochaetota bacterium]